MINVLCLTDRQGKNYLRGVEMRKCYGVLFLFTQRRLRALESSMIDDPILFEKILLFL